MRVAHHLIIIGGISSVTTSYRAENPNLLFGVSIKSTHMNLNGTEWMNLKNFEKNRKFFGDVLKIWQRNTCRTASILKTLQAAIIFQMFSCILRKWLSPQETFCRHIQKYAFFVCETVTSRSSQWEVLLKVLGKSFKIVSDKSSFYS